MTEEHKNIPGSGFRRGEKIRSFVILAAVAVPLGLAIKYGLAMLGDPGSVWLMRSLGMF